METQYSPNILSFFFLMIRPPPSSPPFPYPTLFRSMSVKRPAALWRIFRAGGGSDNPTDIPKPLADRLCEAVVNLAEQFFQIHHCFAQTVGQRLGDVGRIVAAAAGAEDAPEGGGALDGHRSEEGGVGEGGRARGWAYH